VVVAQWVLSSLNNLSIEMTIRFLDWKSLQLIRLEYHALLEFILTERRKQSINMYEQCNIDLGLESLFELSSRSRKVCSRSDVALM